MEAKKREVIFVTGNANKFKEFSAITANSFEAKHENVDCNKPSRK